MEDFTAHRMVVRAVAREPILLNEHKGSALRGAFYHGLRDRFCAMRAQNVPCNACPLWEACPVCALVSTLGPENRLGRDVARPYTIQPPLEPQRLYQPGDRLEFGLTLYAGAMRLFPYVVMALKELERSGLGRRLEENGWRRGTLAVEAIWAENPLCGKRQVVLQEDATVRVAELPITHAQILAESRRLAQSKTWRFTFLTPTRLTHRGRLVKPGQITLPILLGRVFDRLESLARHFCQAPLTLDFAALVRRAAAARVVADETWWVELESYSTRQKRATPIGGLVGSVLLTCEDWSFFAPWLVWGQFTHVGKDAVKGNGWYRIVPEP